MGTLAQLVIAALGVSALVAVMSLSLALLRAGRIQLERRRARLADPLRPALLALAAGEEDEDQRSASDLLAGLDQRRWNALEPSMLTMIGKVRGSAHSHLVEVLRRRDAYDRALRQARSRRALRRAEGADRLGLIGDPAAVPRVIELLGDRNPQVRRVAARTASRLPSPDVAAALLASLAGPRPVPARIVAQALLRIGTPAVPALRAAAGAYTEEAAGPDRADGAAPTVGPTDPAAATAIDVLGLLRSVESAPALLHALRLGPGEAQVRAARALGRIGSPAAVPLLVGAAAPGQPRRLRVVALDALAAIGDRRVVPEVSPLLGDGDGRVARAAARALAALGDPGEDALRRAAEEPEGDERAAVQARATLASMKLARERAGRRGRAS